MKLIQASRPRGLLLADFPEEICLCRDWEQLRLGAAPQDYRVYCGELTIFGEELMRLFSLILTLSVSTAAYAGILCPVSQGPDATALCVSLRLKNGRLLTDRTQTVLAPSQAFAPPRLRLKKDAARRQILDDLDKLFQSLPSAVWFGFGNNERDKEAKGEINDAQTKELRNFTGTWAEFLDKYGKWRAVNSERQGEGELLSTILDRGRAPDIDWGPLSYDDLAGPPAPAKDAAHGVVRFTVADPIGSWGSAEYQIDPSPTLKDHVSIPDIIRVLKPLEGTLWRPSEIRKRIEDFLSTRGFSSVVEVSDAGSQPKHIKVVPGPRIARVLYSPPADDHSDLDHALYMLLPDPAFRTYLAAPDHLLTTLTGPPARQALDLVDLGFRAGSEPPLNLLDLQFQKLELAPLGFTLNTIRSGVARQSDEIPYVDLLVEKQSDQDSSDKTRSAQPPVSASPEGVVRAESPGPLFAPPPASTAPKRTEAPPPKDLKNYIGAGFEYHPGQGVRPLVLYQRSQLFGTGGLSLQTGGANDNPLAFGSFYMDFAGFSFLKRRLTLQVTGSTDYTLNRQFFQDVADERRTGGFVRFDLELFHNLAGQQLKFNLEGRRATVELLNHGGAFSKTNLTTLDIGSLYLWERNSQAYPRRLRIEPVVRLGLGASASETTYTRFSFVANYHQQMLGPTEFDITGTAGWASGQTPVFELPSFGGEQTLRGFRQDDVLGLRLWSVQPEVWAPVPGVAGSTQGVGAFLRQNMRLAFFTDFGGVYKTLGPLQGTKVGPGAGIRVHYGLIVLKLDWAKGFGDAATEANWGRFYFSVMTTRAF